MDWFRKVIPGMSTEGMEEESEATGAPPPDTHSSDSSDDEEQIDPRFAMRPADSVKNSDDAELVMEKLATRKLSVFGNFFGSQTTQSDNKPLEDLKWRANEKLRIETLLASMGEMYFGINDFAMLRTIGLGGFSRVKLVRHEGSQRLLAAKQMPKCELIRLRVVEHIQREKNILCTFVNRCNFIVQLETVFHDDMYMYFVTEFLPGGELFQHIQQTEGRRLSSSSAQFYLAQIVLVVEALHTRGIIHRDIKPENVMIAKDGYIKMIDFGFAKEVGNDPAARTHTSLGTPEYMAPECIQAVGHGKGVDLWCLGVILFEMSTGELPFSEDDPFSTYQKILKLDYEFPECLWASLSTKDMITNFLRADPNDRLGQGRLLDVKEHAFFMGIDWAAIEDKEVDVAERDRPVLRKEDPTANFMAIHEDEKAWPAISSAQDKAYFDKFVTVNLSLH